MPRFVDLSIYLENEVASDPPPLRPRITYQKHADTLHGFIDMIPGTTAADYPDGEAAAAEWVTLTTHNGTHLDAPFMYTAQKIAETGNKALIWEGHKAGRDIGYCHLEKLHNLESLPGHGFTICCLPHKIRGASAGWTRAVAIFEV